MTTTASARSTWAPRPPRGRADPEAAAQALSKLRDFVDRKGRSLLIVEDDDVHRKTLVELLGSEDVQTVRRGHRRGGAGRLAEQRFDCMVLDLGLPDMAGASCSAASRARPRAARPSSSTQAAS